MMANGDLILEELSSFLKSDDNNLPPKASNALVLGAIREVYRFVHRIDDKLEVIDTRVAVLETARKVEAAQDVTNVKWPFILQQIFLPTLMTIVTALILYGIGKATGQIP